MFLLTLTVLLAGLTSYPSKAQTVVIESHTAWVNSTDSVYFAQPESQFRRLVMKAALADTAQKLFVESYIKRHEVEMKAAQLESEVRRSEQGLSHWKQTSFIGAGVIALLGLLLLID